MNRRMNIKMKTEQYDGPKEELIYEYMKWTDSLVV